MRGERREYHRYHGLIVEARSDGTNPDNMKQGLIGQHCINCGEYVDQLVHGITGYNRGLHSAFSW